MKVCIADQKKRVVLPGILPGDCFRVREIESGHLELLRLIPQPTPQTMSAAELEDRWDRYAITPRCSWEELRKNTREL